MTENGRTTDPELSVVVCTFNGAHRLARFLPSLHQSTRAAACRTELVVVDDGSTDGTADAARRIAPGATVVCLPANRGLPAARNAGAAAARAPWLLYCDDDVELPESAISSLYEGRVRGQCVVPAVVGPDGAMQNSVTVYRRRGETKFRFHEHPVAEVAYPVGSCFLVSRTDYTRAGGCDERIVPMYYDDAALGARLLRTGTATVMAADVRVVHHQHGADPSPERRKIVEGWVMENRWVYALTQLDGRERVSTVALGLPRVLAESARRRSVRPLMGYAKALGRAPSLVRSQPAAAPTPAHGYREQGMSTVPGWFSDVDALLFELVSSFQQEHGPRGDLLEIGAYLGRSSILLGHLAAEGERVVVCDLFGAPAPTAANQHESDTWYPGLTRSEFESNYLRFHAHLPTIHQCPSAELADREQRRRFRFAHVDASHTFAGAEADIALTGNLLVDGGILVIDDYRTAHAPGVAAASWAAVASGALVPICASLDRLYASWGSAPAGIADYLELELSQQAGLRTEVHAVAGQDLLLIQPTGYGSRPSWRSRVARRLRRRRPQAT